LPAISKYWNRTHYHNLPSKSTVQALADEETRDPHDNAKFVRYMTSHLNRSSMTDKTYLDQHPSKVAGDSELTYAQQLYGFHNYHELIVHAWVYFPDLEFTYSKEGEPLSQWEQCCVARIMLRKDWTQADVELHIGVVPRLSHYMKKWTERWRDVEACILCRHVTSKLLDGHQINGFTTRYKKKIACLVDGTVVNLGTSRQNSVLQRSTWSNKSKGNAAQGLAWVSPAGFLLVNSSLFNGRLSEKDTVWLHRELLRVFPRGYGQLVDRGFSSCTAAYEHLVQCFFPAFAKDLCTSNIIDAKKQSADRYVVETFFSRVKEFRVLSVTVPVERVWMIESAWVCALAATDLYAPLRKPSSWEETQTAISLAKAPLVDCLFKEAAGKPLPWFLQVPC
jgi:hypothetical protein